MEMSKCSNASSSHAMCSCDIGTGAWIETEERYGHVNFLPNFFTGDLRVLAHIESTNASTGRFFFFTPFSPLTWLAVASLIVTFIFLKLIDKRFLPYDGQFKPLPPSHPWYMRAKHSLLKGKLPYRMRKAAQSTCTFELLPN